MKHSAGLSVKFSLTVLIFALLANTAFAAKDNQLKYSSMYFFEAGKEPTTSQIDTKRNTFHVSDTRYIYTLVRGDNRLYGQMDQNVIFNVRYVHSDGTEFGNFNINHAVSKTWEEFEVWYGWGWETKGYWKPDKYRVELRKDGKLMDTSYFTVVGKQAAAPSNRITEKGLVVFDQSSEGYRFKVSEEWREIQGDGSVDFMIERNYPYVNVNVVTVDAGELAEVSESMLKSVYKEVIKEYSTQELIHLTSGAFKGKPGGWYEFKGERTDQAGLFFHVRQYFVIHNSKIYILTITTKEKDWAKSMPHWKAVLLDFQLVS